MPKPTIWILDTGVFTNILDIDGWNQDRAEILAAFEEKVDAEDSFMIPFTTILETGNFIHQMPKKGLRQATAQRFADSITASIRGEVPWRILGLPEQPDLTEWLGYFPIQVETMGLGDHLIVEQWRKQCEAIPGYIIKVWSLDKHLNGYECNH